MRHIVFFENLLGKDRVISDDQKLNWGKDWTKIITPNPMVVLFPQETSEVQKIIKYCGEQDLKVVPSGGRTGLSGGAIAALGEVVISTSRMNKIFAINELEHTMHCQSGVVTKEVQRASLEAGLYFPVDFASSGSSHIGGNISTNAGGIKVIRYGLMRDWVLGLKVVLSDGTLLEMNNACVKNNTGIDLKHLFIGSEGTLGFITECLLKLTSIPVELVVSLFAVETLEKVTLLFDLAKKIKLNLTAYEFFTQEGLERVNEHTKLTSPFSTPHPFYALVEIEKESSQDVVLLEAFVEQALEKELMIDAVISQSAQQTANIWGLRENISESITSLATAHKNDISLPLSNITIFCTELQTLIEQNYPGTEVVLFGHIGDGNLHVNFIKPPKLTKEEFFKHAHEADHRMFELVKKYGGSISAEHGVGLLKKDFLGYTRSPTEIEAMKSIKRALDPKDLFNPGKIFGP